LRQDGFTGSLDNNMLWIILAVIGLIFGGVALVVDLIARKL
jgi:hypothetical protein